VAKPSKLNRRDFIGLSCSLAALPWLRLDQTGRRRLSLVVDPADVVANAPATRWAINELEQSLNASGVEVHRSATISDAGKNDSCLVVANAQLPPAVAILKRSRVVVSGKPESLALVPARENSRNILLACGRDSLGLVYALLDLADRVNAGAGLSALILPAPISEAPTNATRSVLRLFASEAEDKPWFNDREFWSHYLTMLATQRFNRFNLSLSLGYDFLRRVTDAYFLFPYPFLFSVPGYNVRVPQLSAAERDRNLAMLKFIGEQTVARGLQFQLGLWMHGYEWIDSPNANYTIQGLSAATHGPYCRDALRLLLQTCPAIGGVTIRTHGESGVEEGSYQFWQTVFDGVASCGRRVELDLHPKGLDQTMLNNALATRQPVTVSPKFWAEHLGLPYHQTDIRQLEVPDPTKQTSRLMNLSEGSRSFMRYGYGDLLREDRSWQVIHRVWPGSQRLLLWGDARAAAAYSRAFTFCGSNGAEIMEPLTFKGRRGSGITGDRCAYADAKLRTRWDWEKYEYTYRVWGRLLYNADSNPEPWQRYWRKHFGLKPFSESTKVLKRRTNDREKNWIDLETALANASRILPLITTAHLPSAANNNYWPEMYVNQSLFDAENRGSYSDTPMPRVFGNVSPLDPQLFYRINDFADDLLTDELSGKYSPLEVAQWLDDYADATTKHLSATSLSPNRSAALPHPLRNGSAFPTSLDENLRLSRADEREFEQTPEYRRLSIDVLLQAGLGHFFAAKFRSAVLYRIFEKTGDRAALASSLDHYRLARDHWARFADVAKDIYLTDITIGELPQLHGHWLDRLPAIDRDIKALTKKLETTKPTQFSTSVASIIQKVLSRNERSDMLCSHTPPNHFVAGKPLAIDLTVAFPATAVKLYYRHVNQAERFTVATMDRRSSQHYATIPADYTNSPYPLQYYFEVKTTTTGTLLYPGFARDLMNQPYLIVRRSEI
jgi:hypothetical protein